MVFPNAPPTATSGRAGRKSERRIFTTMLPWRSIVGEPSPMDPSVLNRRGSPLSTGEISRTPTVKTPGPPQGRTPLERRPFASPRAASKEDLRSPGATSDKDARASTLDGLTAETSSSMTSDSLPGSEPPGRGCCSVVLATRKCSTRAPVHSGSNHAEAFRDAHPVRRTQSASPGTVEIPLRCLESLQRHPGTTHRWTHSRALGSTGSPVRATRPRGNDRIDVGP